MYKCGEFLYFCPGHNFMPIKFEKGERNLNIVGGNVLQLVGSRGIKTHLGGTVGGEGMRMLTFSAGSVANFSSAKVFRCSSRSDKDLFSESQ